MFTTILVEGIYEVYISNFRGSLSHIGRNVKFLRGIAKNWHNALIGAR